MRVIIRFIISLCFLLWGGYTHAYQQRLYKTLKQRFERSAQASSSGEQDGSARVSKNYPANSGNNAGDAVEATEIEEEEDESNSFKKRSLGGNGCLSFLDGQAAGDVPDYLNAPLPFCEHFSYYSSNKFIFHRVIRI